MGDSTFFCPKCGAPNPQGLASCYRCNASLISNAFANDSYASTEIQNGALMEPRPQWPAQQAQAFQNQYYQQPRTSYPNYPAYAQAPYPQMSPAVVISTKNNGMCVASLVLGILALVLCWIPIIGLILALLAVILGGAGISAVNKNPALGGKGMGIAGLVMGIISLVPIVLFWAIIGSFLAAA